MEGTKKSAKQTLLSVVLTMVSYFVITGIAWVLVRKTDGLERIGPLLLWFASGVVALWVGMAMCKRVLPRHSRKWLLILVGAIFANLIWQTSKQVGWGMALLFYGSGFFPALWAVMRLGYAEGVASAHLEEMG